MSLDKLKKFQFIDAAEWFGVSGVEDAKNNEDRLTLLVTDGVTWDLYEEERNLRKLDKNHEPIVEDDEEDEPTKAGEAPVEDESAPAQEENSILIKMERKNFSFEHKGARLYRFTKKDPYQLVNPEDEQALINMGGFRTATQNEVKDFYN